MFAELEIFQRAYKMAHHAGQRQAVIAENIANADTPDFKARDIASFSSTLASGSSFSLKTTRAKHFHQISSPGIEYEVSEVETQSSPNGNSVSIEEQMLHAVDTKRQHDRATTIYKSALDMLRQSLRSN